MAVVLFAVIYGGSRACQTTLLWLHFIPEHRNYYACLIHRRGNYSIMVHGEFFFCCWAELKSSRATDPMVVFNKEDKNCAQVLEKVQMCNRFLCAVEKL